jgi:RNase adaptor protein for sRNA GlmZ degradation
LGAVPAADEKNLNLESNLTEHNFQKNLSPPSGQLDVQTHIEVSFWCHGGKQRSVAASRIIEHCLRVFFGDSITVPRTKHMMRY